MHGSHLGSIHADDAVRIAGAVEVVRHAHRTLAGGYPFLLGARVNLEHMCLRGENRLLPNVMGRNQRRGLEGKAHDDTGR